MSEQITGQITIDEWLGVDLRPRLKRIRPRTELRAGEYVKDHGMVICHIMRPSYIGKKIVIDRSEPGRECYQVAILVDYIKLTTPRAVVNTGKAEVEVITFRPGVEIYEVERRATWTKN